jgi:hypothetical protein
MRSKSRDRGLADLRSGGPRRTVKHLVNTLLGKEHKNHIFGAKDHHHHNAAEGRQRIERLRERRLSAPGLGGSNHAGQQNGGGDVGGRIDAAELSLLAAETRSLMLRDNASDVMLSSSTPNRVEAAAEAAARRRLASGNSSRRLIGHPSSAAAAMSEASFPLASRPHMRGGGGGQVGGGGGPMYRRFQDSSFSSFRQNMGPLFN